MNRWLSLVGLTIVGWLFCTPAEAGWVSSGKLLLKGGLTGEVGAPVVGDLDGDGSPEIVAISVPPVYAGHTYTVVIQAWHHDGTLVAGWPVNITLRGVLEVSGLSLGDIDGAPGNEVVLSYSAVESYETSEVVVLRGNGTVYKRMPNSRPMLPLVIADVNRDGVQDIVMVTYYGVTIWNRRGVLPGWPVDLAKYGDYPSSTGVLANSPAAADVDGDGKLEIIAVSQSRVYVWKYDGTDRPGWPVALASASNVKASPIVAKLDGSSIPLIVVTVPPGGDQPFSRLLAFRPDGTLAGTRYMESPRADATPAVADINSDGRLDLITAGGSDSERLQAVTFLPVLPAPFNVATLAEIKSSPVVARLTDGTRRIYAAASDGRLYGWDGAGRPVSINGQPFVDLYASEPVSPTLADLDRDGSLELIVLSNRLLTSDGVSNVLSSLRVIKLGIQGRPEWATFKRNAQRTGWYK